MAVVTKYQTADGMLFNTPKAANKHEGQLRDFKKVKEIEKTILSFDIDWSAPDTRHLADLLLREYPCMIDDEEEARNV